MATVVVPSPLATLDLSHRPRRVLRALGAPLRVRIYILAAIATVLAIVAVRIAGAGTVGAARDVEAHEFQSHATASAATMSARIASINASLAAADVLMASGTDLAALCNPMSAAPRRPYQRLFVFDPAGSLRCTTVPDVVDQPDVIHLRSYFQLALNTGEDQVGGPLTGAFSGRAAFVLAHPIPSSGSTLGVVVAAVDATDITLSAHTGADDDRVIVLGRDGATFEGGASGTSTFPSRVDDAVAQSRATGDPCPVLTVEGRAWTCSPVDRSGLMIVAADPSDSVFALASDTIARQRDRTLGVLIIGILATVAVDLLFVQRVQRVYAGAGLSPMRTSETASHDEIDVLEGWVRTTEEALHGAQMEVEMHERRRRDSERELLTSVAEIVEIRYPFLRNHGDRVGRYSRQIGKRLGFRAADLDLLEFAARVHDVGKIAIADAVYLKTGSLDPIETVQMQLHAARGGEIATRMRTIPPGVADAIRHHHERWDGAGYPDGLAGTAIPLWARVIAVADSYDAMTEIRPYRDRALSHDEAIDILRGGAGSQWDATAVQAFLEVVAAGEVVRRSA